MTQDIGVMYLGRIVEMSAADGIIDDRNPRIRKHYREHPFARATETDRASDIGPEILNRSTCRVA